MTDKEKAIVMAYTGITMLTGDKFDIFHEYVEEIMNRPVFSHEFAMCAEEIKERAKPDFLKLCAEEGQERPHGEWKPDGTCSECGVYSSLNKDTVYFCPNCGASMRKEGDEE